MKKFISVCAALFIVISSFANGKITIHNNTTQDINFQLFYSNDNTNHCLISGSSSLLVITAGNTYNYDFSANVPSGVTATDGFYDKVIFLQGDPNSCPGVTSYILGNPCLGLPTFLRSEHFLNSSCGGTVAADITWDYSDFSNIVVTIQ